MNLADLIANYMRRNFGDKTVILHHTSYDGDFEVIECDGEYELASVALDKQGSIWKNGTEVVSFASDWCQFARDVFAFVSEDNRRKLAVNIQHLPQDLMEKYAP